ncbi:DUF378 domain-containing protein [Clostridium estertheticum]|uniref:DUF378 domain-containing protein n=1 Tax=Clostridium estertheticum TaxID=238834 RepID=UPI0013E91407|nr:DUF378 domain-containing protein [Clostridium estertheticum]MBN4049372.1 DUF378 domain-containing protein [bacterium AH-315-N14]MBZ9688860.1 DUF378 domain-containing protein [Clostridium estertheticum]
MKALDTTALVLVIIGAVNWGLIGFFRFDLVSSLFGTGTAFTRIIFSLVGIAGLYSLSFLGRDRDKDIDRTEVK